ncbi:NUDIX domain-containing protein [Halovivax gelatinilyticus]|uniref:NUDIX domain-containing protein n=1 Tax=Halovivax gelatinilyticus TaxID=2961597 RepID=UPI0020CA6135|nr:NUDIX domain-containing protein [Halovivax gelatinilyticus]
MTDTGQSGASSHVPRSRSVETDGGVDEPSHVVTAFLRNRGEVLFGRRSDAVGTYAGDWGAISGYAEGDPDAQVWTEIREETGLDADEVTLVRSGRPVTVGDSTLVREWVVHPYLFDAETREVDPSAEHDELRWLAPTSIVTGERETVPALWEAYERVAPTVRSITADGVHGASSLSIRALEVLRDRAGLLIREREGESTDRSEEWDELAALANRLLEARPSMAVLRNRVNRAMADAATVDSPDGGALDDPGAAAVLESTIEGIERAVDADRSAAEQAADLATGRIVTLSRSETVADALRSGSPDRIFVAESWPGNEVERERDLGIEDGERRWTAGEGVAVAEELRELAPVTLCPDSAVAHLLASESVDRVLVGADTILPDGRVVNKVGTRAAALAAAHENVPVYAIAASEKVSTRDSVNLESGDQSAVYDGDAAIDVVNPTFDVTPAGAITGIVTENGVVDPADVGDIATTLRKYETWNREA